MLVYVTFDRVFNLPFLLKAVKIVSFLAPEEGRDLFAHVTGPDQVPLPADADGVPVEKPM